MIQRNNDEKKIQFSKRYFFVPIILIISLSFFLLIYEEVKDKTISRFNNEQLILAKSASKGISSFFNDFKYELTFLSQLSYIIDFDEDGKDLLSKFYKNHSDQIEAITRVDSKGKIMFTYPYIESAIGQDISHQKHVQQVIATQKPIVSDVFMSVQGYLAIAFHVPIFQGKEYRGSLAILIELDRLGKQYLENIKVAETGHAWLISENKSVLYCSFEGHAGKSYIELSPDNSTTFNLIKKIEKDSEGTAIGYHDDSEANKTSDQQEKIIVFNRVNIENTYWTILIGVPEEEIYSTITSLRNRLILLFSILLLIMAYYFYSFTKARTILKEEKKRKDAEKTLRDSEEQFRLLFEHSPIGIGVSDQEGKLVACNNALMKQGNYNRDEVDKIIHVSEFYYDIKQRNELLELFQKQGYVNSYNVLFKRKDGSPYDALISLSKTTFKGQRCIQAMIEDITDRKRAESELRENEVKLRNIFEHSTNLFYSHDANHVLQYISPQIKEILGYEVEEALIKWTDLASDNPINEIGFQKTVRAIETGIEQEPYELELIHKNGRKVLVEVREAPVVENGRTVSIVGSLNDITERKRIEAALIDSEKKFRHVVEEAVEIIFTTDMNGYFTYANPAGIKSSGYTLDELKKLKFVDIIDTTYKKIVTLKYVRQFRERTEIISTEYPFRTKSGELKWFNQNSRLIIENNVVKGFYVIARDVTERKRAEMVQVLQYNIADAMVKSNNLNEFLKVVRTELSSIMNTANFFIAFYNEHTGMLQADIDTDEKDNISEWQAEKSLTGYLIKNGVSRLFSKSEILYLIENQITDMVGTLPECWLGVPLFQDEKAIGALVVQSYTDPNEYNNSHKEIFELIANQLSIYIQHKKVETIIHDSEKSFKGLFHTIGDAIYIQNFDATFLDVNDGAVKMYGYERDEFIGKTPEFLSAPGKNDFDAVLEHIFLAKKGIPQNFEFWGKRKNGEIFPKFVRLFRGTYFGDDVIIAIATDISDRKQAEQELLKLSRALEESPAVVLITDRKGEIEYVNRKFTEITGYTREEVIGKNTKILKSGFHDDTYYKLLWDTITSGKDFKGELLNKKKNGEVFWESQLITPLLNNSGEITHFVAVKEDITEKKKMLSDLTSAKEKAVASEKIKSEFLAQMSHEIRTPINIILSNASLLKDEISGKLDEDLLSCFDSMDLASQRIIRTIDLILNMSEIQTGSFKLISHIIDLNTHIISPLIREHKRYAAIKNIDLIYHNDLDTAELYCDDYCVTQICANLIDNAIKYTKKGKVEVSLYKNELNKFTFEVKDTGVGMSQEFLDNLFNPFVQEEQGYERSYDGNGLGLALVKKYCDFNNAEIKVESEKNVGSTFRVVFN